MLTVASKPRPLRGLRRRHGTQVRATWSGSRHVRSVINNSLRIVVRPGGCVGFRLSQTRHACPGSLKCCPGPKSWVFLAAHIVLSAATRRAWKTHGKKSCRYTGNGPIGTVIHGFFFRGARIYWSSLSVFSSQLRTRWFHAFAPVTTLQKLLRVTFFYVMNKRKSITDHCNEFNNKHNMDFPVVGL